MGVLASDVNYDLLLADIKENCLTEDTCGTCQKEHCLVGYTKKCINDSLKSKFTYLPDGMKSIPHDMRAFEEGPALKAIAHILRQCKSCEEDHMEDCLVNIIRSCYETITMGEAQSYEGSIFLYLSKIEQLYPMHAKTIMEEFRSCR